MDNKFTKIDKEEFKRDYIYFKSYELCKKYQVSEGTISKWAKKLLLPKKHGKWQDYIIDFEFNEEQKSIIDGSLLGDGSLTKQLDGKKRNCSFVENHCMEQYDYLYWKHIKIGNNISTIKKFKGNVVKIINGKLVNFYDKDDKKYCNLNTLTHPYFTNLEKKWYKRNINGNYIFKKIKNKFYRIKIIPNDFKINNLNLSIFYLDDGCNVQIDKRCEICFHAFDDEEVYYLDSMIKDLGIKHTSIKKNKNN